MEILNYNEFVSESASKRIDTPLSDIIDAQGKVLASLPQLKDNDTDFMQCPRYEFVFTSAKDAKEFADTTYSNDFWKAIYGYDSILKDTNDFSAINAEMKKFGNKMVGRKLYVYCYDKSDTSELEARCENAKTACNFSSVKYIA